MVAMVVYYAPVARFLSVRNVGNFPGNVVNAPEESMGGRESAVSLENASFEETEQGLPEPLEFSKPRMLLHTSYTVQQGDVLGEVAKHFGLSTGTLVSLNNVKYTRNLQIGHTLKVPNQDGIIYKVKKGDSLRSIAGKHKIDPEAVKVSNELFSDQINENTSLFLPGAVMPWEDLQEINGDLFLWPVRGYVSSYYGYRRSPFTGARSFHSGLDIAAPMGTAIRAAMSGRVSAVGYDNVYGNFVVITHQAGYRTLYGHMSVTRTRTGVYVNAGDRIGDVGSTGQSTGPHVHFTVYKNGATVNPRNVIR
ncbi:MAG: peptidoglycan DD-metalloendopeptidase family protein [Treponema sp.]|jgi:murein DD-endopeptidase MepM/ murein hydrolase activator NlpD|nr:peptidoglycan DD-metalloendopeptidase family protein [Treponema sp.]